MSHLSMHQLHRLYGYFLYHGAWDYAERVYGEMEKRRKARAWLYLKETYVIHAD